jgi:putative membrane protein
MVLAHGPGGTSPWEWQPYVDVWIVMGSLLAAYFVALRYLAPGLAPAGEEPASTRQRTFFVLGVLVLWIGADWPMHRLSEEFLFSAHMVQHTLFSLVAPPLLLLGLPAWLLRAILRPPRLMSVVRFLTRPVVALLIFNSVIVITHWPPLVDWSLRSDPVHFLVHLVLVSSALLMWWPVVDPLPETSRLSEPAKGLYLFLQSIVPTVPASFLTFASEPIYKFYETVPRLWGLSVVNDQRIAGLIMKIGGGLLLWSIIAVLFFRWHAKEEAEQIEEVTWTEFERELETWGLRK